jgi:Peptidase family S49 N-terminal
MMTSRSWFCFSTTMMMMMMIMMVFYFPLFVMSSSCTNNAVCAFQTSFTSTTALTNRNFAVAQSKASIRTTTGSRAAAASFFHRRSDASLSSPSWTRLNALSPHQAAAAAVIPSLLVSSTTATASDSSDMTSGLLRLLLESIITNGVPALFTIITIGFAAFVLGRSRKRAETDLLVSSNPVSELYDDLYGDQEQDTKNSMSFPFFGGGGGGSGRGGGRGPGDGRRLPKNAGIPQKQYLKITHLNRQIDSYQYSLTAATKSKAAAAAQYRKESFRRAFVDQTLLVSLDDMSPSTRQALLEAEGKFLKSATKVVADIQKLQTQLTQVAIDEELQAMGLKSVYDLDPPSSSSLPTSSSNNNATDKNTTAMTTTTSRKGKMMTVMMPKDEQGGKSKSALLQDLSKDQRQLQQLELDFIKSVVLAVGPQHGAAVRTALLGDVAARGAGGLLQALQERRPLASSLTLTTATTTSPQGDETVADSIVVDHDSNNNGGYSSMTMTGPSPSLFVCRFPGDATASQVANLRQEVTAIVESANNKASTSSSPRQDEVLVILQTGGGTVTGYGLAASQLLRFKEAGLKLTIAVEQVAASGGYMMCKCDDDSKTVRLSFVFASLS